MANTFSVIWCFCRNSSRWCITTHTMKARLMCINGPKTARVMSSCLIGSLKHLIIVSDQWLTLIETLWINCLCFWSGRPSEHHSSRHGCHRKGNLHSLSAEKVWERFREYFLRAILQVESRTNWRSSGVVVELEVVHEARNHHSWVIACLGIHSHA